MSITLTDEQKNVIKTFIKFLMNPQEKYMIIQGAAGTGKTTMIKEMLVAINKQYKLLKALLCVNPEKQEFEVVLSTTTNKAAAVLRDLSDDPFVKTVHSLLGLKMQKDFRTGEEHLVKTNRFKELDNTVLVLDEASMLDKDTFQYMEEALVGKSKAVLIGDVFQLAPVNSKMSLMQQLLHKVPTAVMSKVMRHGGPILEAATAFREVVQTQVFEDILLSDKVIHMDYLDYKNTINTTFGSKNYAPHKAKVLAWSNDRVQQYNSHLRAVRGLDETFQLGEYVVTNKPIISQGCIIPVDSEVEITYLGSEIDQHGIAGRRVEVNGKVMAFLPNDYQATKTLMKQIANQAKKAARENKHAQRKEFWELYFEIKDTWLDLRSQFASTVHKAQGSSYDEVFIDLDDIGRCNIPSDTARMLYVAISRARKRVVLAGTLPDKYRGAIAA